MKKVYESPVVVEEVKLAQVTGATQVSGVT